MSEKSSNEPRLLLKNIWAREAGANAVPRPMCHCLHPQYDDSNWSELQIHVDEQDTECSGWQRLQEKLCGSAEVVEGYHLFLDA